MATLGEAAAAELDRLLGAYSPPVAVPRGFVSPKPQATYLVGQLGAGPAAALLGVTPRTLRKWLGGHPPTKANTRKLDAAYHEVRDPRARKAKQAKANRAVQQRLIKALTSPPDTRIQVSGTVLISDDDRYRQDYGGTPAITVAHWVKIVDAWKRKSTADLRDAMEDAINEAAPTSGPRAYFPDEADNHEVHILLTLAEG